MRTIASAPWLWCLAALLRVVSALIGLATAAATGLAASAVLHGASTSGALGVAVVLVLGRLVVDRAAGFALTAFAERASEALRVRLAAHLLDLAGHPALPLGARAPETAMTDAAHRIGAYTAEYLTQCACVIVVVPTGAAVLVALSPGGPLAALLVVAGIALTLFAQRLWRRITRDAGIRSWAAQEEYAADMAQALAGMGTLLDAGAAGIMERRLARAADEVRTAARTDLGVSLGSWTVTAIATGLSTAGAVVAVTAGGGGTGGVSADTALIVSALIVLALARPVTALRTRWHEGFNGVIAARTLFAVLDTPPAASDELAQDDALIPVAPEVRFTDVDYRYDETGPAVLTDVGFTIPAGRTTAVIGPSGSGKSTLLALLRRADDRYTGSIELGGTELRRIPRSRIAAEVVFVDQRPVLFGTTIRDNLDPLGEHDPARMRELCDAIGLGRLLDERGLDGAVGPRGSALSGGQRQRIAAARALLRDPAVLVLDEASASLDGASEARLLSQLTRLRAGRTTIVVAHRPATMRAAAHVVVLDAGRIVDQGSPDELLTRDGLYARAMRVPEREHALPEPGPVDAPWRDVAGPADAQAPLPHREPGTGGVGWRGLLAALRGHRGLFAAAVAAGAVSQLAAAVSVIAAFWCLAASLRRGDVAPAAIGMAAAVLVQALAAWLENSLSHLLSFDVAYELRRRLFAALAHVLPHGLGARSIPDLVAVMLRDTEKLEVFYAHTSIYVCSAVLVPVAGVALLLPSTPLAPVLLPILAVGGLAPSLIRRATRHAERERAAGAAELRDRTVELVATASTIAGFRRERRAADEMRDAARRAGRAARRSALLLAREDDAVTAWTAAVPLAVIALLVLAPPTAPDAALALVAAAIALTEPVEQLIRVTRHNPAVAGASTRIHDVLVARPLAGLDAPRPAPGDAGNALELRDLRVRWPGAAADALHGVDVAIPAHGITAVVGSSGSGKSTLVAAIAGRLPARTGTIAVRGEIGGRVAVVGQEAALFRGTLRSNLSLNRLGEASDDRLSAALELAAAGDVVARLQTAPDTTRPGLDAPVADDGSSLSGGQRQRIALARSFLAPLGLLVLDEAASQLDVDGEARLGRTLRALARELPVVLVAHRIGTILLADRVIVLDEGRLVGSGTPEELMDGCAAYRRLVEPQLLALGTGSPPHTCTIPRKENP